MGGWVLSQLLKFASAIIVAYTHTRTHNQTAQPALDFIHDRIAICFVSDLFKNEEEEAGDDDGK